MGYGGAPYGGGPYGSADQLNPHPLSAASLDGFRVEIQFSEEMDITDPALLDTASYTFTPVVGATTTLISVAVGTMGTVGALSVILTHAGSTLGGTYSITITGPTDLSGNLVVLLTPLSLFTLGEPPPLTANPLSGTEVELDWAYDMLIPGGGSTIDILASYDLTHPAYPISSTLDAVSYPYDSDASKVLMTLSNQTNHLYTLVISPATAIAYDASALPDVAGGFTGTEISPANGSSTITTEPALSLSRNASVTYGWTFADTSARLVTGTTFRVDFTFDSSAGSYTPALSTLASPVVGTLTIEDSAPAAGTQILVSVQKDGSNNDVLRLQSGAYDQTFSVTWATGGQHVISVVRNIKADIYTLLFDGVVVTSTNIANFSGVAATVGSPGVAWIFANEATTIAGFRVHDLSITSSSTVYSNAWNFLHNYTILFTGSILNAQKFLLTQKGPLVKDWGDATPATTQDVTVTVNGTGVVVETVNPYIGRIELETAVPTSSPPPAVLVDYQWKASPIMELAGLNTEGLVFNKWDRNGSMATGPRFPMGVVLGPTMEMAAPVLIGHRYLGFEQDYSALWNSPTTLLLNINPHRPAIPGLVRTTAAESISYDGLQVPTADTPVWTLQGTDAGQVNINEGTYTVIDESVGSDDPTDPQAVVYSRTADLTFPSSVNAVGRFAISDDAALVPDGVFTGVGFGVHDNHRLYVAGALRVNGLDHVGLLLDATRPHEVGSWSIGPFTTATVVNFGTGMSDTVSLLTAETPPDLAVADRFQILAPENQEGVYTVASVVQQTDGTTTVVLEETFPQDPTLFGNKYPVVHFETPWVDDPTTRGAIENQSTYRLVVDPGQKQAQLIISGGVSGTVATLTGSSTFPQPADTSLLIPVAIEGGSFFWGSLSSRASSQSTWSFFRYGVTPDVSSEGGQLFVVDTDMSVLPEDVSENDWLTQSTFGLSEIDTSDRLLLKNTSANTDLDFTYSYARVEPLLDNKANLDFRANFRVESGTRGDGGVQIQIGDSQREVSLGTLLYREDVTQTAYRELLHMPAASFSGVLDPTTQGFNLRTAQGSYLAENRNRVLTQTVSENQGVLGIHWYEDTADFDSQITAALWADTGNRIFESRFAVTSYVADGAGFLGVFQEAGAGGFGVSLGLVGGVSPQVRIMDAITTLATLQDYAFDWDDGEPHTYRILTSVTGDTCVLVIDDVVQAPTLVLSTFGVLAEDRMRFGVWQTDLVQDTVVEWYSASYLIQPPADAKRTLGLFIGDGSATGGKDDINNWELPRTDSSTAANSDQTGPVIEEMDWTAFMDVRLYRDPTWGVTLYRPDLALPPYYVAESATPGSGFAVETTEPSAGWINVEYRDLPYTAQGTVFGIVSFGATGKASVSQSRWDSVSYRLHKNPTGDYKAPQGMVFNRFNTISSGEILKDVTPEQVIVQPVRQDQVSLLSTHLYADRVFKVIEDGREDDPFTSSMFVFEPLAQTITLVPDVEGQPRYFATLGTGLAGSFPVKSRVFTDVGVDFVALGALPGHMLHVTSGLAMGSYLITAATTTTVTVATAFVFPSVGDIPWQVTQQPLPVTVVFAPGERVTNTYLAQQPLLDSVTLLNEGTPPFPKSQLAEDKLVVIHDAGTRDLVDDTPADVLADDWRVLAFAEVAGTYYESMDFQEIDNTSTGGQTGLISMICEGTLGIGATGFDATEGEAIYSPTGGGAALGGVGASAGLFETGTTVGGAVGAFVLSFGPYHEQGIGTPKNLLGAISSPVAFIASGNGYYGPPINQVGSSIAVLEPLLKEGQPGGTVEMILKNTTTGAVERFIFNG